MKTRLYNRWEKLQSSYWFIPGILAASAILLASATIMIDEAWDMSWLWRIGWFYRNEAEGSRLLLSTVAGSVITVTGVVFSITIVALTLASQQFGPRLLYNFMRDRGNQVVFGVLIATFLYCLLILRTIRPQEPEIFVPHDSVLLGFLLAILSLAMLIYFIHHVSDSIQAMTIIDNVSKDIDRTIDRLFPGAQGIKESTWRQEINREDLPKSFDENLASVRMPKSGYLQAVDMDSLIELAQKEDLVIQVLRRPGDFLVPHAEVARVWPKDRPRDEDDILEAFIVGKKRTHEQDIEFLVNELVEIAVRALSPGVNDPFTAMTCVDRLGAALCNLAGRSLPLPYRYDKEGQLRLIVRTISFSGLVNASFNQIRQYGRTSAAVTIRQLETIRIVCGYTQNEEQRQALLLQAGMIERGSHSALPEANDRKIVHERYLAIFELLKERFGLTAEL